MNKQRIAELAKEASDETGMMMIMEFKNYESALWENFAKLVLKEYARTMATTDTDTELKRLRLRNVELEKENTNMSWTINPDRMGGGSFYEHERDDSYGWK